MSLGPSQDREPEGRQSAVSLERHSHTCNVQMRTLKRALLVKEIITNQIISKIECPDRDQY